MKIAMIGTGNVGGALTRRLAGSGHSVCLGVRHPDAFKGKESLEEIPGIRIASPAEAVRDAEVVIITTPAHVVNEMIPSLGDLSGKIVIDATNAVRMKPEPYQTAFEALQKNTAGRIVKAFNTTGFENMAEPVYATAAPFHEPAAIDVFVSGDDAAAKDVVKKLAADMGFGECYDFGGSDKVLLQEQFALAWINLAIMQGHGRNMAFKIIRRK